jgi:hypothetical protein
MRRRADYGVTGFLKLSRARFSKQFNVIVTAGNVMTLTALKDDHPKLPQHAIESSLPLQIS